MISSESTNSRSSLTVQFFSLPYAVFVDAVLDDARDAVFLVRDHRVFAQVGERQLGEHLLGGDALLRTLRRDASQHVSRTRFIGFGQHFLDVFEVVSLAE
ncbi:MAG: hypothetical protein QM739_20070 [Propionivibrio sp.]